NRDNERLILTAGRSNFTLPTLPKDDFPLMSTAGEGTEFSISPSDLKLLLDKNKFAMSQEETRYYLNGIYIHFLEKEHANDNDIGENGGLVGVATDGHRLSKLVLDAPKGTNAIPNVIIPRKTVIELRKLIEDVNEAILVNVTETKIVFQTDNLRLVSKLIDGTFPEYQNVIPAANDKHVTVQTKDLINAVDRVATISSDKVRAVKLSLEKEKMIFRVENSEFGTAVEEIEADYDGDALQIGFNARYLLDILAQLDTETAQMSFGDVGTPVVVHNHDDKRAIYILMPMRI
ncbi:MAG: DNA polymerase III subunit beta, partial [Pseudomonadota bacterium]